MGEESKRVDLIQDGEATLSKSRTIKVAVSLVEEDKYKSVIHTTTMTVQPIIPGSSTKSKSRIVGTYALQYKLKNRLLDLLTFGPCRTRKAKQFFVNELAEYAQAAEKRYINQE